MSRPPKGLQRARAGNAERRWEGSLWEDLAFLQRYGPSVEFDQKYQAVCHALEGFTLGLGTDAVEGDLVAIAGLEKARDRFHELRETAAAIELDLRDRWGYEWHPKRRVFVKAKTDSSDGSLRRGPARELLTALIEQTFALMTEKQAWERSNSSQLRAAIRARIAEWVESDALTDDLIRSRVNNLLNPERER